MEAPYCHPPHDSFYTFVCLVLRVNEVNDFHTLLSIFLTSPISTQFIFPWFTFSPTDSDSYQSWKLVCELLDLQKNNYILIKCRKGQIAAEIHI